MFLYYFIFTILAIFSFISHGRSQRNQRVFGFLSAIIIVGFQGIRWRTGTDWEPYYDCFRLSDKYQVEYVEWGYYMFNRIIKFFTDSYTVFLLIQCGLIAYCHIKMAEYFNVRNTAFVMLFTFASTPFPIRYTMAVSFFLMAYRYIVERNILKFVICYIMATMCHQIVVFTLPFYFFCQYRYPNKLYFLVYAVCCVVGLMVEFVFSNMLGGIELIFNYLPEFSQNKANAYLVETEGERSLFSTIISFLNGAVFIFLFTKLKDKYFKTDNKYLVLLNLYVFGLCFGRVVIGAVPYLARVIACFSGGFVLMLYLLIASYRFRNFANTRLIQYILLILSFVYASFIYNGSLVKFEPVFVPYYSIFSTTKRAVVF